MNCTELNRTYKRKSKSPVTLINVYEVGEYNNNVIILYEFQEEGCVPFRLTKGDFEKRLSTKEWSEVISRGEKDLREVQENHSVCMDNPDYQDFILYLLENATIGGFQAPPEKIEELRIDYFNDTGEEIPIKNVLESTNKYGKEMRMWFLLPENKILADIILLLPEMPKVKKVIDQQEYSFPTERDGKIHIDNMRYVRTLLQMGFRYGNAHNKEKILSYINETVSKN